MPARDASQAPLVDFGALYQTHVGGLRLVVLYLSGNAALAVAAGLWVACWRTTRRAGTSGL
jgi:hypothetical protein